MLWYAVSQVYTGQEENVSSPLLVSFRAIAQDNEDNQNHSFVTEHVETSASVSYHNMGGSDASDT